MTTVRLTGSGSITLEGNWTVEGQPPIEPPPSGGGSDLTNPQAPPAPPAPKIKPGSTGRVLTVGSPYGSVKEAIEAAADGDTVKIPPGTPRESFVCFKALLIDGEGVSWDFSDVPVDQLVYQGKAGIVMTQADSWHIRGMTISGCGIRESTHTLVAAIRCDSTSVGIVERCVLSGNQNGVAADSFANWDITVDSCLLTANGIGGGFTHNCYVNDGYAIRFKNTDSVDPREGYCLKSRAWHTFVEGGTMRNATASLIDCSNGGLLHVTDAMWIKPANAPNRRILSYALEYTDKGLLDNNLIEKTTLQLDCNDTFIQSNGGTITFAQDCTWHGQSPAIDGDGTVVGVPGRPQASEGRRGKR